MGKIVALIISIILTIASTTVYFILNEKIIIGEKLLADGQKRYAAGQQALTAGKAKLAAGKQQLSTAKTTYNLVQSPLMQLTNQHPIASAVLQQAENKITSGDQQVESGVKKIRAGEAQLKAGKIKLEEGRKQLDFAKELRFYSMLSAAFFALLSLIFLLWVIIRRKN